jgi:predicted transcriptional regulator
MSMVSPPRPTEAELKLLKILWELGPAPVKAVHAALARQQSYTYTGALRMLQVMLEKGLVVRDERSRSHIYRAAHARQAMETGLVADFMDRLFGGSALALLQTALQGGAVSAEEKAKIRELLALQPAAERHRSAALPPPGSVVAVPADPDRPGAPL